MKGVFTQDGRHTLVSKPLPLHISPLPVLQAAPTHILYFMVFFLLGHEGQAEYQGYINVSGWGAGSVEEVLAVQAQGPEFRFPTKCSIEVRRLRDSRGVGQGWVYPRDSVVGEPNLAQVR